MISTRISHIKRYFLFIILLILVVIIGVYTPRFRTISNFFNISRQITVLFIVSIGMTFAISLGGIDLSVGSSLALSGIIMASFMKATNNILIAVIVGIAVSTFIGFIQGVIISKFKITPFIVTLGMMTIARGLALVVTDGRPITLLPESFTNLGYMDIFSIPVLMITTVISFFLATFLHKNTKIGLYACAIGGNEIASRYSGIKTDLFKTVGYSVAGFFVGVGSVCYLARVGSAHPTAGFGLELNAIAATVIGGTPMVGGSMSIIGTLIGAIILGVLRNGFTIIGISSYWQEVATGIIIIIAVALESGLGERNKN